MPESDWPPAQRRLARLLRTVAYSLSSGAGVAVILDPPPASPHLGWALGFSALAAMFGAIAAIGAAVHRWQVEWVAVWFIATAYLGYGILAGLQDDPALAASLQLVAVLIATRGVDLWVFSLNLSRARRARIRAWRRVAGLTP